MTIGEAIKYLRDNGFDIQKGEGENKVVVTTPEGVVIRFTRVKSFIDSVMKGKERR